MHPSLPVPLDAAFSGALPGHALPPGPRVNLWTGAGATPDLLPASVAELVDALWHPGPAHRRPDGTVTSILSRPVPSAGACYPVRTHVVSADGSRYAVDHDTLDAHRRDAARDVAAGWPSEPADGAGAHLVFTVLPGRTFGRYRHRAWPLWIADVAYTVAGVRFLLGDRPLVEMFGPSARLRTLLGMPRAADTIAWTDRGLAPEIPLAAIAIPDAAQVLPDRRLALHGRRSPAIAEFFTGAASSRPRADVEQVAVASGQAWVRGATSVASWSIPATASAEAIAAALWRSHLAAARHCYLAALSGAAATRPVSGFAPGHGRLILHAIATLSTPPTTPPSGGTP